MHSEFVLDRLRQAVKADDPSHISSTHRNLMILSFLRPFGVIGYFLAIMACVLRLRKSGALWADRVVVADHANELIQKFFRTFSSQTHHDFFPEFRLIRLSVRDRLRTLVTLFSCLAEIKAMHMVVRHEGDLVWARWALFNAQIGYWPEILRRRDPVAVAVVDDVAPERLGIAICANALNIPVWCFLMEGLDRPSTTFEVEAIFFHDKAQLNRYQCDASRVAVRTSEDAPPIDTSSLRRSTINSIGIVVNAWGNEDKVNDLIDELSGIDWEICIVRFHPRAQPDPDRLPPQVEIHSTELPVSDFASSCDLIFAGDTTAIEPILRSGTPVVTVPDLDTRRGRAYHDPLDRVPILSRPLANVDLHRIARHYEDRHQRAINMRLTDTHDVPNWENLLSQLLAEQ